MSCARAGASAGSPAATVAQAGALSLEGWQSLPHIRVWNLAWVSINTARVFYYTFGIICKLLRLKYVIIGNMVIMDNYGIIIETPNAIISNDAVIIAQFRHCNNDVIMTY